jgi:hypothetical protein
MNPKLIFVCSPYGGEHVLRNIDYAKRLCRAVIKAGHYPFAPHLLYPQFLDDQYNEERALGVQIGDKIKEACDELHLSHLLKHPVALCR